MTTPRDPIEAPATPEDRLRVAANIARYAGLLAEAQPDDVFYVLDRLAAARGRQGAVGLDTRCVNCWHDKGHHVHWSDDRIGACVLVYGGGQGRCPCEQYAARHGRSSDPTEAE